MESFEDFLDSISDAPPESLAYVRYCLDDMRGMLEHWRKQPGQDDGEKPAFYVCFWIESFIHQLQDIERRMMRERGEVAAAVPVPVVALSERFQISPELAGPDPGIPDWVIRAEVERVDRLFKREEH